METFELIPVDQESSVAVPVSAAQRWEYFEPLLSGKWNTNNMTVPFTAQQLEQWLALDGLLGTDYKTLKASGAVVSSYSQVAPIADYFGASERWLEYVRVDDTTPENERRQAYLRQGRYLRSLGTTRDYYMLGTYTAGGYVLHHNFFLASDPVYDAKTFSRGYDQDFVDTRWSTPITPEQRERALALDNISVLTGILTSAWLLRKEQGEVHWADVAWRDLVNYVPYPGILGAYSGDDRLTAISRLETSTTVKHEYYEYALAGMQPVTEPHVGYETSDSRASGGIIFAPSYSNKLEEQLWSLSDVFAFYDKMSEAMKVSPYRSRRKSTKNKTATDTTLRADELSRLRTRVLMCGLSPVLPGGKISDINKLSKALLPVQRRGATVIVTPEAVVPIVTLTTLYIGQYLRFGQDHLLNDETIPEQSFPAVISYYLENLGATSLVRSCEILMEYYLALPDKQRDDQARVLTFCELALAAV